MKKFTLYKNKNIRPSENYSIRYDKTIVAIIPDYMSLVNIRKMIKRLNNQKTIGALVFKLDW